MGLAPKECDLCRAHLRHVFIDGRTTWGPWANMCVLCHREKGVGLGDGRGQKYRRDADGIFYKEE